MGQQLTAMTAWVRFSRLLEPVLSEMDDARIAVAAMRIQGRRVLPDLDVVPVSAAPELTDATLYALHGDPVGWHAVRLLIQQGKLPADARVPVRILLNTAQWRRAGLVAQLAQAAHRSDIVVERPRRNRRPSARALSPLDLVRHL